MLTEVCVDSVEGVRIARDSGADRVELCCALELGGLTPSLGLVEAAVAAAGEVAVQVLVRPRPGGFVYHDSEIAVMARDLAAVVDAGAAGVVFGVLTADATVDVPAMTRLIRSAAGVSTTFHRAIDVAADPWAALDVVTDLGIDRVLTSGGASSAAEGIPVLRDFVQRTVGGGPVILAGGGIRPENVTELVRRTGVAEVHFSARGRAGGGSARPLALGSADDGSTHLVTDAGAVAATVLAAHRAG